MNFCVIGTGAWGTAFALHLVRLGHTVTLVARRLDHATRIASERENTDYLPGVPLPLNLQIGFEFTDDHGPKILNPIRTAAQVDEIYRRKRSSQPLSAASAGCTFKNPDLPGRESAGWLLDRVGLKGMRRGDAEFSDLHANFIVNRHAARCGDVE